jgi:hypothetical protein
LKRTLKGIAAASIVLGMMAPAAFASTVTSTVGGRKAISVDGKIVSQPFTRVAKEGNVSTSYMGIWYLGQAIKAAGGDWSWDPANKVFSITIPGVDPSKLNIPGGVGTGNSSIVINGTVVKKVNSFAAKDPAGGKQDTTFMPIYYLGEIFGQLGGSSWDGNTFAFKHFTQPAPSVSNVVGTVNPDDTVTVTGVDSNADSVQVSIDGGAPAAATLNADGTFTYKTSQLAVGTHTISVVAYKGSTASTTATATVTIAAPTVSNVTASNLKQVVVTFNKPVDSTTATTVGNYQVGGSTPASAAFVPGSNTQVVLTLSSALTNQSQTTIKVSNVKDLAGNVMATYSNTFTPVDTTAPSVVGVKVIGPQTIAVQFSEPVHETGAGGLASDFAVDNGAIGVSNASVNDAQNEVILDLGTALSAGQHTVTVNPSGSNTFTDYAGFPVVKSTQQFNVTTDTTAPTVSVTKATPDKFTVTFSKPVDTSTVTPSNFYVNYSSIVPTTVTPQASTVVTVNGKTYATSFDLTFSPALTGSSVTLYVKNTDSTTIKDVWGNKFVDTSLPVALVADTTKPTVTSVTASDSKTIKITFSKDVNVTDATTAANYTLEDSNGNPLNTSTFADVDNNGHPNANATISYDSSTYTVTIHFTDALPDGTYQLKIANIEDTVSYGPNKMDTTTKQFTLANNAAPVLSSALVNGNKVLLTFSKPMATSGSGSVLDPSNYQIAWDGSNPSALPAGSTIALGGSSNVVVITLGDTTNLTPGTTKISASVKDASGNQINGFNNTATVTQDNGISSADIVPGSGKLLNKSTVQFAIDRPLSGINASDVKVAGIPAASVSYVNQVLSDGKTYGAVVTVTVPATNASNTLSTYLNSGDLVVNGTTADGSGSDPVGVSIKATDSLGKTNGSAATATNIFKDYAPAYVVSYTTKDTNGNGEIDEIQVKFSEPVLVGSVSKNTFTVSGYTITNVVPDPSDLNTGADDVYDIILQESGSPDTGATPNVTLGSGVTDASPQANVTPAATSATAATDGAAPVVLSAKKVNATTIVVTLSENVSANTLTNGAGWTVKDSAASPNSFAVSAAAFSGNTVTLTVADTSTASGALHVIYTQQANKNQDAAGNDLASTAASGVTVN